MFDPSPFFDYNISVTCVENDDNYNKTIKLLFDFGYRTVAINQIATVDSIVDNNNKKKKRKGESKQQLDPVPPPFLIRPVEGCESMKILNRLTVPFYSAETIFKVVKSPNFKQYHILAVMPESSAALLSVASTIDADILCFNSENKHQFKINRKILNKFIDRGIHIEIPYGPAIEDTTKRKQIIHLAHTYHALVKSRKVIVSSGATNPLLIRNPYDIVNLGLIFGLNEQQAKNAITHCGRQVFINSVGRRHGKAVMFVKRTPQVSVNASVIEISESDDDLMEIEGPASKKARQDDDMIICVGSPVSQ